MRGLEMLQRFELHAKRNLVDWRTLEVRKVIRSCY